MLSARITSPRASLPPGVPNYVTPHGLALLHAETAALEAERGRLEAEIPDEAERMLRRNLGDVDRLLVGSGTYSGRGPERAQGPREWFTGARIETVWQTLHGVERALIMYRSRPDLEGSIDGIVAEAKIRNVN